MKIRVGILGIGAGWEQRHRLALKALSDRFEVVAVCDQVAHRAEQVAKEFQAQVAEGIHLLARRADIDALLMLSRQWYGLVPILAACDAGKSLYCAGGWDLQRDEVTQIRSRVQEAGICFLPEFPHRFAPATLRLKELMATRLGPPRMLFCHQRLTKEDPVPTRHYTIPHDPLQHNLVELVDWCRFVVGNPPNAVWGMRHPNPDVPGGGDYEMISVDFSPPEAVGKCQVVAQISSGRYMASSWKEAVSFRPPSMLQVVCEQGVAFVDLPASLTYFDSFGRHMETLESERPACELLLNSFHRKVTSLVSDRCGIEETSQAILTTLAARTAYETGARQDLRGL